MQRHQSSPNPMTQRLLLWLVSIVLPCLLGGWLLVMSRPSFAATLPITGPSTATCATTQGAVPVLCEKQDPTVQQCDRDAQSRTVLPILLHHTLIGEVDLRFSPLCRAYWVRTIVYGSAVRETSQGLVINVEANIIFPDQTQVNADNSTPQLDGSLLTWTTMITVLPPNASGIVDLSTGQSIIVPLSH